MFKRVLTSRVVQKVGLKRAFHLAPGTAGLCIELPREALAVNGCGALLLNADLGAMTWIIRRLSQWSPYTQRLEGDAAMRLQIGPAQSDFKASSLF